MSEPLRSSMSGRAKTTTSEPLRSSLSGRAKTTTSEPLRSSMPGRAKETIIASRALAHPVAIFAIALLVVNDHVLKAAYPGLVTGKLSDFAGLMFFPLLLAAACEQIGIRRGMTAVVAAAIATGIVFASIKLSPAAGELYRAALAVIQWPFRAAFAVVAGDRVPVVGHVQLVADRTDLVALVALAVPIALARHQGVGGWSMWRRNRAA